MDDIPQFCKRALLKKLGQWGELPFVNINISSINTRIGSQVYTTVLDPYWLEKNVSVIKMTFSIRKFTVYIYMSKSHCAASFGIRLEHISSFRLQKRIYNHLSEIFVQSHGPYCHIWTKLIKRACLNPNLPIVKQCLIPRKKKKTFIVYVLVCCL